MAWQPIYREREETAWHRLVGRGAMLALGVALLWGGWACASKAVEIVNDNRQWRREAGISPSGRRRGSDGTGILWIGAAACGLPGAVLTLFAVAPASLYEHLGTAILGDG